jgi:predicted GIY-YIG superfamily endonuclease
MDNQVHNYWLNTLKTSTAEDHCVYNLADIDKVPNVPGIYAWYLKVDPSNIDDYYKIYKQKKVKVTVDGHLKEAYKGEARHHYDPADFANPGLDFNLCEIASLAFSPPLYIGISKDLGVRLKTHTRELTDIFYGKINLPPPVMHKSDFDTIIESAHFAQRMGHSIRSFKNITINALLIRTIEMPAGYVWQDLQKVEKYLNRTYNPIYGRK